MATTREVTFGTTPCLIHTRYHVQVGAEKHPAIATASANGAEITENGRPVERTASTEDGAAARMSEYLETRFGQRT